MSGAARPAGPAAVTGPAGPAVYQGSRPLPAGPGPSAALLQRFPPRPAPASWPLTSQPKPQVLATLLAPPFPAGRPNLDQERRRGLIRVLDWLEAQPGDTWQNRWITSGADAAGNPAWRGLLAGWLAATGRGPRDPEHVSLLAGRAIMLLVCADVIRPSLGWLLSPATPAGLSAEMTRVRDPAGFAALAVICQENCVNSHTTQLALRRIAAILAAKGGQVADITIGDCLELLQLAGDLLRSNDATSPYFYQLLRAAGIFGDTAPPGQALKTQGLAQLRAAHRPLRHHLPPSPGPAGGLPARTPARRRLPHLAQALLLAGPAVLARPRASPPGHRLAAPARRGGRRVEAADHHQDDQDPHRWRRGHRGHRAPPQRL